MTQRKRHDLLPALRESQSEHHSLSEETLIQVSDSFGIPNSEVYGVSSFYSSFSTEPKGRYVIRVCKNVPCYMQHSQGIIDCIREAIGISPGETTRDGRFSLELTNCIGACDTAPAMMVNDEVHGNLTPEKISKILKECP